MGCRLVKASEYKDFIFFQRHGELYDNLEEIRYKEIRETFKHANHRMEQLEKIFEVLTNDSRLKDIKKEIEKINIIFMFHYNNRRINQPLVKIKSSFDKIEKQLNEPARDYNAIKELVESQENSITNLKNIKIILLIKTCLSYRNKKEK